MFNTTHFVFLTNCNLNKKLLQQCAFLIHLNKLMQNKYKFTLHQNGLIPKSVKKTGGPPWPVEHNLMLVTLRLLLQSDKTQVKAVYFTLKGFSCCLLSSFWIYVYPGQRIALFCTRLNLRKSLESLTYCSFRQLLLFCLHNT